MSSASSYPCGVCKFFLIVQCFNEGFTPFVFRFIRFSVLSSSLAPIRSLLTWTGFRPFARLTYGVYLVHPLIILFLCLGGQYPIILDNLFLVSCRRQSALWLPLAGSADQIKFDTVVTPFRCLTAMQPGGSTRAEILPGCSSLNRGSREAVISLFLAVFTLSYGFAYLLSMMTESPTLACEKLLGLR
ncbi:hypothetical protein T265_12088 [Opisthorchis viverrini]|uniref:Acyltransferase 3 domain-containing protein n=1 Tax=Opisthorchis viverrini TaxID=6198 RepID=A0A074Z0E0_OPIVI|nr:hypothetical protein T265_12088 [Opisthorchis viverrini]KER18942.1 hypothetical protein T265_12088 [Opisthorchis viverrini]